MAVLEGERTWPDKVDDAMLKLSQGIVDEAELRRQFGSSIDAWLEKHPDQRQILGL